MSDIVTTVGEGGQELTRPAAEAAALGAEVQHPAIAEAREHHERRKKMFDNVGDKLLTVAEAAVDTFMVGMAHQTGEEADLRREANTGSVFLGSALGVGGALLTGRGPAAFVNKAGEAAGRAAAQGVLKAGAKSVTTRALQEAGAGAALTGATSFGHALLDTVIEDRPFAGEAIIEDMKLGTLIGLGAGGAVGLIGKVASGAGKMAKRGDVSAQGGFIGGVDDALDHFETARAAHGEALHFHERQLGALKEFRRVGQLSEVSDDFLRVRTDAVNTARRAQQALRDVDLKKALDGSDPAAYKNLQRRWSEYSRAMDDVDEIMAPHSAERSAVAAMDNPGTGVYKSTRLADDDLIPVVKPGDDFIVKASEVGEAIPDSAAYARGVVPEAPGTVPASPAALQSQATPPVGGLAALDAAIEKMPLRGGVQNAEALASAANNPRGSLSLYPPAADTVAESAPYGRVAKQFEKLDAEAPTKVRKDFKAEVREATRPEPLSRQLLDDWLGVAEPRVRPWHEAQARARSAMEALYGKSGGRLDSARSLGILEADGVKPATDMVGSYMDSVYALNRAGRLVADEARGIATPLRAAGKDAVMGAIGLKLLSKAGLSPGIALTSALLGYGGRLAAATGRLVQRVTSAVEGFMSSTKIRAVTVAATNTPWSYSDRGPIQDPVERIQEIQFLASNPDAIRARIAEQAGELAAAAPDHIRALQDAAVRQISHLAIRAPAIYFDRLGRPLMPPQGKMRQFFEYENGVNDLEGILRSLQTGSITQPQVDALQTAWSSVHVKVAAGLLHDPEALQKFSREKLRTVEMVTGMPLTAARDPMFLMRQQATWMQAASTQQQPTLSPQAFNINPDGAPTPSQANATGRAPGN